MPISIKQKWTHFNVKGRVTKMGQMRDSTSQNVLKLILKSTRFVPFETNLTQFECQIWHRYRRPTQRSRLAGHGHEDITLNAVFLSFQWIRQKTQFINYPMSGDMSGVVRDLIRAVNLAQKTFSIRYQRCRNCELGPKWVWWVPNGSNPGLFQISAPKWTEIWSEKVPDLSDLGQSDPFMALIWHHFTVLICSTHVTEAMWSSG